MSEVAHRVEAFLAADPEVTQAAVVEVGHGRAQRLVGFVQRAGDACPPGTGSPHGRSELDRVFCERIRRSLKAVLPEAALVLLAGAIPLDPRGEPDRIVLARRADGFLRTLAVLVGIWGEVLGSSEIDGERSFLAHGGSSLAAMRASNRIRDRLGVKVPLPVLVSGQAAVDVAAFIASNNPDILEMMATANDK